MDLELLPARPLDPHARDEQHYSVRIQRVVETAEHPPRRLAGVVDDLSETGLLGLPLADVDLRPKGSTMSPDE